MTFFRNENGQGMVEYALIIGLIAIVVILAVTLIGRGARSKFNTVQDTLENAR